MRLRLCALLCAAAVASALPPVAAQEGPPLQLVRLAAISPWVDATRPLRVTVQITNTTELDVRDASVVLRLFPRVGSRSALRAALDQAPLGGTIWSEAEAVGEPIAPGEQRTVTIERGARQIGALSRLGVYPLSISVTHSAGEMTLVSALPYFPSPARTAINVAWVLPVSRPLVGAPDGVYGAGDTDALALDQLTQQLEAIAARPGASVTLAPSPGLVDLLTDIADGFAERTPAGVEAVSETSVRARSAAQALGAMREAARAVGEVATIPYAPANLVALARHGLRADLLRQVTLGRSVIERSLGVTPEPRALVPPALAFAPEVATALSTVNVRAALVDPASIGPLPESDLRPDLFGPSRPVELTDRERLLGMTALLPDPALTARLDSEEQGVLLAQAIVAETASAWFELPLRAPERIVVLTSRTLATPPALDAALAALSAAPWVRLRTITEALDALKPEPEPVTLLRTPARDRPHLEAAREARAAFTTLAAITSEEPAPLDALNRLILTAESAEWQNDPAPGVALARAASTKIRTLLAGIDVFARPVTLTSRTGTVPITVINRNQFPVRVRLHLDSAKLRFPAGSSRVIEIRDGDASVDFRVEARTGGTFPLRVRVQTPDGKRLVASGTLAVRSTAVSAVALTAVAGSAAFLLLPWVRRGARRRRNRR